MTNTQPTHHEDIATISLHFHEDELLAYASTISSPLVGLDEQTERLAAALRDRLMDAAITLIHADRANRRKA